MENKLKEQLRLRMLGQLSDEKTELDVNNAYIVVKESALSFFNFLRENYHTEFETWTRNSLPKGKVQNRENYNIINIEELFKTWENEIN